MFTISCIFTKSASHYYTGQMWDKNISRAHLYSLEQSRAKFAEFGEAKEVCMQSYVIQNNESDYYNGEGRWVLGLVDAKQYTLEGAHTAVKWLG